MHHNLLRPAVAGLRRVESGLRYERNQTEIQSPFRLAAETNRLVACAPQFSAVTTSWQPISILPAERTRCDNQTPMNTSAVRPPDPYPDCKQATLQTSSKNDSRVWGGVGYSRSVATGGSARVATGKRRGGAGADRIGQDLHLRAALSEPENSGGVHRPDPRTR
jgi:hypothetical protein